MLENIGKESGMPCHPLEDIPEFPSREAMTAWLHAEARRIASWEKTSRDEGEVFSFVLEEASVANGLEALAVLRKFILALLAADWACYAEPASREEYGHLRKAVSVFPRGFRLWMVRVGGRCMPIGYTGFHPISRDTFSLMKNAPERLTSRKQIAPEPEAASAGSYFYLYNLGIIRQFQGTAASRALVKAFAADVASVGKRGLAAVVVSQDGKRIIEKFGLHQSGCLTHEGHRETVYVTDEAAGAA